MTLTAKPCVWTWRLASSVSISIRPGTLSPDYLPVRALRPADHNHLAATASCEARQTKRPTTTAEQSRL